jgi:hypothetical protein
VFSLTRACEDSHVKALLVVAAACAALGVASAASAADRLVERGIVQSADRSGIVLRALDGTEITVVVGPETRFRLNGRAASLVDIRRGFVAEAVTLVPGGSAAVIRAFGRLAGSAETGRLVRLRPRALVVRRDAGGTIRIPLTARTTVWRAGGRIRLRALRPGMAIQVVLAANGSARVVLVQAVP